MTHAPNHRQAGAALLTVLLLVAVMAVLMAGVLDDVRFALRRAGNTQAVEQAQWHALGAERLARAQVAALDRADPGRTLPGEWHDRPIALPVDDGDRVTGLVQARLSDATTCFNLNSVVEGAGEQWQRRDAGAAQFAALLRALGLQARQAAALTDALVDWIDSDGQPSPLGAEDGSYLAREPAYRTAGTLLAEPSELRAIAGFDSGVYDLLRPHVCASPGPAPMPVNLNMLAEPDAPLVQALAAGDIDARAARRAIAARPAAGWRDTAAFWAHPAFAGATLPVDAASQVALRSRYFELHVQVRHDDAQVELSALLEHAGGDAVTTLARRWTAPE
jgi:general secretion pathway protein K